MFNSFSPGMNVPVLSEPRRYPSRTTQVRELDVRIGYISVSGRFCAGSVLKIESSHAFIEICRPTATFTRSA